MATLSAPKGIKAEIVMRAETTAGVDPMAGTYTTGDIVPIEWDSLRFTQDPNEIENKMTAGSMGRGPSILGKLTGMIEASMLFRGAGTTYTAAVKPEIDMILRASGHSAVFDTTGGAKWTYKPTEVDETFTCYAVVPMGSGTSALSFRLLGGLGFRLNFAAVAGEGCLVSFGLGGAMDTTNGRADLTYVSGTLSTVIPPTTKSAAFIIDDGANYVPRIKDIAMDIGREVSYVDSINASGGVVGALSMDRSPTLSFTPEADLEANSGWWGMLNGTGSMNWCTFHIGTVAFNRLKFKFGANGTDRLLQLVRQSLQIRNGLLTLPSLLRATLNAAGSDYSIVCD